MPDPTSRKRSDDQYEIEALAKGLKVLEAMQDCATMAIQTRRVQLRTGFSYDFCMRALKTLKIAGYVAETETGWKITPRTARIGGKLAEAASSRILNNQNPSAQAMLEIKDL